MFNISSKLKIELNLNSVKYTQWKWLFLAETVLNTIYNQSMWIPVNYLDTLITKTWSVNHTYKILHSNFTTRSCFVLAGKPVMSSVHTGNTWSVYFFSVLFHDTWKMFGVILVGVVLMAIWNRIIYMLHIQVILHIAMSCIVMI